MEAASSSAFLLCPNSTKTHLCSLSNPSSSVAVPCLSRGIKCLRLAASQPSVDTSIQNDSKDVIPILDVTGKFCSPRAARELALVILYAACLDGSDPVRLFERRLNDTRDSEYDKEFLMAYDYMSFGGPPVTVTSSAEADDISQIDRKQSEIEAEILSAPPKLVYSKLVLRFSRKLLVAVSENWNNDVQAIEKIAPPNWMKEAGGRILEFSVLHLAMAEIAVLGTRHQIVINEAVDLAKRFCDGAAPRIINGCLRNFIRQLNNQTDE